MSPATLVSPRALLLLEEWGGEGEGEGEGEEAWRGEAGGSSV